MTATARPAATPAPAAGSGPPPPVATRPRVGDRRRRRLGSPPRWARRAAAPLIILGVWHLGATTGFIHERTLASPIAVTETFWELLSSGELPQHLLVSLQRAGAGLAIGILVGVTLAVVAGLWTLGEDLVDTTMNMLRAVPFLALVPLFIVWFGVGETTKVLFVGLATTFPIYINTYSGIRNVDAKLIEAAEVCGVRGRRLIREVIIPGALPQFLVGLRVSLAISWISLIAAEQINATQGLGYLTTLAREFYRTDILVVGLVTYAVLGLTTDFIVRTLERRLLTWRRGFVGT